MLAKEDLAKRIGSRLTAIRKQRGLTNTELAKLTKLSPSLISRISNGRLMASINTLGTLADALAVDFGFFFQPEDHKKAYVVSRRGKRSIISPGESHINEDSTRELSYIVEPLAEGMENPLMLPLILTATKDDEGIKAAIHGGQEFLYVLEGKCLFTLGDDKIILNRGDALYFDATIPHKGSSISKKPTKILSVHLIPSRRVRTIAV